MDRERRRELVERFRVQKETQIERNVKKMMTVAAKPPADAAAERKAPLATKRENRGGGVPPVNLAMLRVTPQTVTNSMPVLVQA